MGTLRGSRREKKKKPSRTGSTLLKLRGSHGAVPASAAQAEAAVTRQKVEALFDKYRGVEEDPDDVEELELVETDAMGPNGMALLLNDLGLVEDDVVAFVVAWKLGCGRASRITREEFVAGLLQLQCGSVEELRARLPQLESEYREKRRAVYSYAFNISRAPGSRTLDLESGRILLELFLPAEQYPMTGPFVEWLVSDAQTGYRALNADQYSNWYDLCHCVKPDLSDYDLDDGWPSLFDEFYEYSMARAEGAGGTNQ